MPDVAILIPTHRHAELLPFALRSALRQEGLSFEVLVVGDGVDDVTRAALAPFLVDPRVRFFDLPKGERHGELLRHAALLESSAPIVCYLSDDDLLLPSHVAQAVALLRDVDFVSGAPVTVWPDGSLRYNAFDLGRSEFRQLLLAGRGGGGLTGVAHTRELYERLPVGWSPAPPDVPTDLLHVASVRGAPGIQGCNVRDIDVARVPESPQGAHDDGGACRRTPPLGSPIVRSRLSGGAGAACRNRCQESGGAAQAHLSRPRGRASSSAGDALVACSESARGAQASADASDQRA